MIFLAQLDPSHLLINIFFKIFFIFFLVISDCRFDSFKTLIINFKKKRKLGDIVSRPPAKLNRHTDGTRQQSILDKCLDLFPFFHVRSIWAKGLHIAFWGATITGVLS